MCVPALSLDEYLASRPLVERELYFALEAAFAEIGAVHVEAVTVGILFKRERTFAELRPRRGGAVLWLRLSRRLDHPRVSRCEGTAGGRTAHAIPLDGPTAVDAELRSWLAESYLESPTSQLRER